MALRASTSVFAGCARKGVPVTVHLSIDFLDMGRAGEWVIGEASLTSSSEPVPSRSRCAMR